jgi:hypothetical protein
MDVSSQAISSEEASEDPFAKRMLHAERSALRRQFGNFINRMSSPLKNIDPRVVSAIHPIFGSAWVVNTPPIPTNTSRCMARRSLSPYQIGSRWAQFSGVGLLTGLQSPRNRKRGQRLVEHLVRFPRRSYLRHHARNWGQVCLS